MSIGTLIFLLFIGGSLFAMVAMHRGGSDGMGMGMGCGSSHGPADDHRSAGMSDPDVAMTDDGQGGEPNQPASNWRRRGGH